MPPEDTSLWQLYIDNASRDSTPGGRICCIFPEGDWGWLSLYTRMYVDWRGSSLDRTLTRIKSNITVPTVDVGDTIWQDGTDTLIGHMTVRHEPVLSGTTKYAQHFDAWGHGNIEAVHVGVDFESYPKHAVGVGMHPGQNLWYYDCVFRRLNGGAVVGGTFNWHNFNGAGTQTAKTTTVFDGSEIENLGSGDALQITSFFSGAEDEVYWKGAADSLRAGSGGVDLYREGTSDVIIYATPGSYTTATEPPEDITGLILPVPTRMPTRY